MTKLKKINPWLKNWNKKVFGDLRLLEADLNNRLKELDSLEGSGNWRREYMGERENLKKELHDILIKKEISVRQKLKIQWAKERDTYSKLFHILLNARKSKNFISKIELDNGKALTREEDVVSIVRFFERLYSYEAPIYSGFDGVAWDGIASFLSSWIERLFTEVEVKDAVLIVMGTRRQALMVFLWQFFNLSDEWCLRSFIGQVLSMESQMKRTYV